MRELEPNSIDAIVTDPPYGLSFMGKHWDHGVPGVAFWTEALRVAKAGTYLLAFGGTRTYHRMTCAIEDAGWEIHDCLTWLYGSGFPKHKSKLKPAWEPIVMARKPAPRATLLNIDACRLEHDGSGIWGNHGQNPANHLTEPGSNGTTLGTGWNHPGSTRHPSGRWPANVCCDEEAAAAIDAQSGERKGATSNSDSGADSRNTYARGWAGKEKQLGYGDTGGASRFFYCAKASRSEREAGLEGSPIRSRPMSNGSIAAESRDEQYAVNNIGLNKVAKVRNHHPTVKPVALMRWLVRLVTPVGGTVLDPFAGSGTTGIAAVEEDRSFIGIENDDEYLPITDARIRRVADQGSLFRPVE